MGSVKNVLIEKAATQKETGVGVFEFRDDYSVFDYGSMPDKIPGKGEALCRMSAYNFRELEKLGIKHHMRKLISGNKMQVSLVQVLYPQKNQLTKTSTNYLIPLEVIFRNSLPKGSSVFKRIEAGELKVEAFGLTGVPKPGDKLKNPILDVSTKLEQTDRYMDWQEAKELACLTDSELKELKQKTLIINDFITKKAEKNGLEHADGKVEFGMSPKRELILLDVLGTLDENRLLYNGIHVNKQVLRDYYKTTPWYEQIEKAKKEGIAKGNYPKPPKLPKELIEIVSNMYKSVCEAWIGEKIWNSPSIVEVVESYKKFLEKAK